MESGLESKRIQTYSGRRLSKPQHPAVQICRRKIRSDNVVKPQRIQTHNRRRLPKPQQPAVTRSDNGIPAAPASPSVGPVGYEMDKQNQHLAVHLKLGGLQAEPNPSFQNFPCSWRSKGTDLQERNPLFQNFPRSRRSKRADLRKKIKKVVDSDQAESNMQECPSKALPNRNQRATRKRKGQADSNDSEDYEPCFHVHGQRRGSVHGSNSCGRGTRKRKGKADSSESEIYTPRARVRGQRRGSLHCSNSIARQGMLNSQMFDLYFENIWSGIAEEKRNSFAYLDCLWFNLYTKSHLKEKVLNWIKRKDIFSKKYVLVPIVMWSHWSLLILCHFGEESKSRSPCMVFLDSLQSANQSLEPQIRKFVLDVHETEERAANRESIRKIPFLVPKVPQQRDGEECGCYVLFYINLFLENAPESFSISEGYPYFMKEDWFSVESLDNFCHRLGSIPAGSSSSDE